MVIEDLYQDSESSKHTQIRIHPSLKDSEGKGKIKKEKNRGEKRPKQH